MLQQGALVGCTACCSPVIDAPAGPECKTEKGFSITSLCDQTDGGIMPEEGAGHHDSQDYL